MSKGRRTGKYDGSVFKVADVGWTSEKYMGCLLESSTWKTEGWSIHVAPVPCGLRVASV